MVAYLAIVHLSRIGSYSGEILIIKKKQRLRNFVSLAFGFTMFSFLWSKNLAQRDRALFVEGNEYNIFS